ncbi:MAG: hypothetical protein NC831_02080 [Candidatus Omnitrophica bacterium]|nr:hypothetical protein [Candidatus Omnitrophota bacterium]
MKKQQKLLAKHYHRRSCVARQQLKEFEKGVIPFERLNRRAKKLLEKRIKAGYEFPAKLFARQASQ